MKNKFIKVIGYKQLEQAKERRKILVSFTHLLLFFLYGLDRFRNEYSPNKKFGANNKFTNRRKE